MQGEFKDCVNCIISFRRTSQCNTFSPRISDLSIQGSASKKSLSHAQTNEVINIFPVITWHLFTIWCSTVCCRYSEGFGSTSDNKLWYIRLPTDVRLLLGNSYHFLTVLWVRSLSSWTIELSRNECRYAKIFFKTILF